MGTKSLRILVVGFGVAAGALLLASTARADLKQIKAYKEAFPEAKPKCIDCHLLALPKKDDGQHENNDYGKAVIAEAQKETAVEEAKEAAKEPAKEDVTITADTYKKVGKIEDFKK